MSDAKLATAEMPAVRPRGRAGMDLATVLGLLGGGGLIAAAIVLGGSARSFVNAPSLLIVFGGTLSAVTVCFSLGEIVNTFRVAAKTAFHASRDPSQAAQEVLRLAETVRRQGFLEMQTRLPGLVGDAFLHKAVSLVVDGLSSGEVEAIMMRDLQATQQRDTNSAGVLRKAAEYAPAMGLIGTLIGLVQMLSHLDTPSTIGPSMAVALLTTLYGAVFANLVLSPLAAKLDRNAAEEAFIRQLYLLGALSISRQENPRRLEMVLNSVLPPAKRVQYFD